MKRNVSKCVEYRAAVLPSLTVEPRCAPVRSRSVSGAHAAEKTANKRLESASFVRAALLGGKGEKEKERDRSPDRVLNHHRSEAIGRLVFHGRAETSTDGVKLLR